MAYLGRSLTAGNYLKLDDISSQFNGSKVSFNLTSGGQAFYPGSAFSILVSLGGIVQEPESAYTIDQSEIIFASPPLSSDDFFCVVLGVALGVGVPGDGTVSTQKIQDGAVTVAKLSTDARGVGIHSSGTVIGVGITILDFIGAGNTFTVSGGTATISIEGGGSGGVAGIVTATGTNGITIVGVGTTAVSGAANSEGVLQNQGNVAIVEGALLTHQNIQGEIFVPDDKNALLIGPVTVGAAATIDVAVGSVLVIV